MTGRARTLALAVCGTAFLAAAPARIVVPTAGGVAWTSESIAKLDGDLAAMLGTAPALRGAHYGILAVDTAGGRVLFARAPDDEFQPASTLKLLVGSAALELLSPQFRFRSAFRIAPGAFVDVVLGGDPFLTADDFAAAARTVASTPAGRDPVAPLQTVLVDATHFDERPYPDGWTWDDFGQAYAPRVSAAALEENLVHLVVTPAGAAGEPAIVRSQSIAEVADGRAPASCAGAPGRVPVVIARATTGAAGSADTLDVTLGSSGCSEVVGSVPLGAQPEALDIAVADPVAYARETALAALRTAGVPLAGTGSSTEHDRGQSTAAWTHDSQPLRDFLGPRFWIPSDNLVGELLLKELGFASAGAPGTTANGIAYEKVWLRSIGVDPATVTLADGCGMSQYDRITPRDLVTILQHDWNGPNRQIVLDSLPVGGARGTIEGIADTAVAGRVFAKTGSMMHVRGLAGYLATLRHGAVTFAFDVDDWNGTYPALAALRARVLARIVRD